MGLQFHIFSLKFFPDYVPGLLLKYKEAFLLSECSCHLSQVDVHVLHTLRSNIPSEDESPQAWSDLVGVPLGSQLPVSFIMLADPRFQQTKRLLAGLDFAFPSATKVCKTCWAHGVRYSSVVIQMPSPICSLLALLGCFMFTTLSDYTVYTCLWIQIQTCYEFYIARIMPAPFTPAAAMLPSRGVRSLISLTAQNMLCMRSLRQVGGVLSSGQVHKRRTMFAWSKERSVRPKESSCSRSTPKHRRQQQTHRKRQLQLQRLKQQAAADRDDVQQTSSSSTSSSSSGGNATTGNKQQDKQDKQGGMGLLGSLFKKLDNWISTSLDGGEASSSSTTTSSTSSSTNSRSSSIRRSTSSRRRPPRPSLVSDGDTAERDADEDSGVHMYGAAVLALHGNVMLEPITCQVSRV